MCQKSKKVLHLSVLFLAGLTIAASFGRYSFVFDIIANLRLVLSAIGLGLFLLFAQRGQKLAFTISLCCFAWNAAEIVPFYFPRAESSPRFDGPEVSIVFANVERGNTDHETLLKIIARANPSIVVLTEINDSWATHLQVLKGTYEHYIFHPREDKFGMVFLSKFPINEKAVFETPGYPISALTFDVTIEVEGRLVHVLSSHNLAPLNSRAFELRNTVLQFLAELKEKNSQPTIVLGDLNVTPFSWHFRDFLHRAQLLEPRYGRGYFPTWPSLGIFALVPIDYCLHDERFQTLAYDSLSHFGSDHRALLCSMRLKPLSFSEK